MRGLGASVGFSLLLMIVGLVALGPASLAHPSATTLEASGGQMATFEESFCLPTCDADVRAQGNLPPAIVAETGTTLTWNSADFVYHTATSDTERLRDDDGQTTPQVALSEDTDDQACLDVGIFPGAPGQATFEIRDDGLHVLQPSDTGDVEDRLCDEVLAQPDGSYSFTLHCESHPTFQHQLVTITPEME